jgi:hypothetical protein
MTHRPPERWRSLVIEMQAIGRLTAVIFAAATPPDLRLTIVNIFLALMQLSTPLPPPHTPHLTSPHDDAMT